MSPEVQKAFAKCGAFYRDTILAPDVLSLYRVGILFRERAFCDSTYKFGGFAAPHRYLIISANARCVDAFSTYLEWGLCLSQAGSIFKVIGTNENAAHIQITLLEVPEELREEFTTQHLSDIEQRFACQAAKQFDTALQMPALPEHQTRLWLDRMQFPLGVDERGQLFEYWQHGD